jgi:C-terminal processing protease CtpA/Prc
MAFGLVGLLVTIGVIAMIMSQYSLPAAKQAVTVQKQVQQQFGSNTPEGMRAAEESIELDVENSSGGKLEGLKVAKIAAGGPMATDFGLQAGDVIVDIGGQRVRDLGDFDLAKAMLQEAKMRKQTLTVTRGGQSVELRAK